MVNLNINFIMYSSNKTFMKQYAKSSYMQKMNPEY
jgi:hypothetical protein